MNWTEASLMVDSQEERIRELEAERDEALTQMVEAKVERDKADARIRELEAVFDKAVTQMVEAKVELDKAEAIIRNQRDLLDECERALDRLCYWCTQRDVVRDEVERAEVTIAKLRAAQEKDG